jgi:hypothetical protein
VSSDQFGGYIPPIERVDCDKTMLLFYFKHH